MPSLNFDLLWRDHGVARGLKDLGRSTADAQSKMGKLGAAGAGLGGALKKIPIASVAVGILGLGAGFATSITKAAAFDKTMRQVGVQTGQSGKQLQSMTDLALEMGKVTSFSAQGASDAMLELAKGGLTAAQMRAGALQETLTLATAGGLELGAAATYMTQGLTAFGLEATDAGRVSSALAGAANASTASVESMGQALSQVGAGAKIAGLSIEDTTAALAAFDNAGVKGSDAGTSLKTMLQRLVPQTNSAIQAFMEYGLMQVDATKSADLLRKNGIQPLSRDAGTLELQVRQLAAQLSGAEMGSAKANRAYLKLASSTGALSNQFFDAKGNVKDITELSEVLSRTLEGQTKAQKIATLSTLFGSDASRAAAILAENGAAGLAKYVKATNDSAAAQELADSATQGYSGALERFQGAVETAQIQLGTKFLPILTTVLDYLSGPGMDTLQGIGQILEVTFSSQLNAASGGLKSFFDYLSTHQADVIINFQAWGNGVFNFGVGVAKMSAAGLRHLGDFAAGGTRAMLGMVGAILRGLDSIPTVDMSESIKQFEAIETAANSAASQARNDLYGLANGIDNKVVPSIEAMRSKFNKTANQQILTAKQRDAVAAVTIAVGALGTKTDGTEISIRKFSDISRLATAEQQAFRSRLVNARTALDQQLTAARNAGAGQQALTKTWEEGRKKLYAEFVQMGLSKREAGRLADKYAGIKPKVKTEISQPGMTAAQRKAADLKQKYDTTDRTVKTKVTQTGMSGSAGAIARARLLREAYNQLPKTVETKINWDTAVDGINTKMTYKHGKGAVLMSAFHEGGYTGNIDPRRVAGAVHGDEHVIKSTSRRRIESQHPGALDYMNEHGSLPGYFDGGRVFHTIVAAGTKAVVDRGTSILTADLKKSGGVAGPISVANGAGLTSFRGGTFTNLFAANLRRAEKLAGTLLQVFQGGWRPATSYSGTSHAGDAIDFQVNASLIRAARRVGIAAGDRTGLGNWVGHTHAVPTKGAGSARGAAVWQAQDYLRRGGPQQSLRSPWGLESGGVMRDQGLINVSETGPERVLTHSQNRAFENLVRVIDRSGGAVQVVNHYHFPNYIGPRDELVRELNTLNRQGRLQALKG